MTFEPIQFDGPAGALFAIYHPPRRGGAEGALIYLPPFAEEMNQSRRMAALQARSLASEGCGVLLLDPYGTGDSDGDFADARWETWLGDVAAAADWLEGKGHGALGLLGLRLGGLLAAEAAVRMAGRVRKLLLWQPVSKGETLITQFLRLRVAAGMGSGRAPETTKELRARLAGGEEVEVAGYRLVPELVNAIDRAGLEAAVPPDGCSVHWFDVTSNPEPAPGPGSRRVAEAWRRAGVSVDLRAVSGEPFWQIQETTLVPELWAQTLGAWKEP